MSNQIKNNAELNAILMPVLKNVVDYVVQKIWNENRELVRTIVYEAYYPEQYERTGEFKEAWDTQVKSTGNYVEGKFEYDPRLLTVDGEHHGSIIDGQPMTTYLAEVIYEGLSGAIYQSGHARNSARFKDQAWTKKRNVWKALLKRLQKENFKRIFEEGLRQQGVNYKRNHVALKVVTFEDK